MSADHERPVPTLKLVERYIAGELASEEAKQVAAYLSAHESAATALTALREAVAFADGRERDVARRWMELVDRLEVGDHRDTDLSVQGRAEDRLFKRFTVGRKGAIRKQTLRRWMLPTGIAVLFMLIAVFLAHYPQQSLGKTHTYTTAVGQRATLLLNDGTHVMMAPQTTLRLVRFSERSRTIVLDGDAYFDVASSARTPFVVRTGTSSTKVLGTAFEVKHYSGDKEVRVAVATGKVLVSTGTREPEVTVTAGHVLSVTDSTQMVKAVDNIDTEIGWLGDRLVFQNMPMPKVLATLTRWYGYEFRYTDSTVIRQNVTIGLSMRSATEALASLEQVLDVSLTVVGDTVTLTPVHGHTTPIQRAKHYDVWVPTREVGR